MTELINAFFEWGMLSPYAHYFVIIATVCFFLNQVIPYIPVKFTEKVPDTVMVIIHLLGLKHGKARSAITDYKGNAK